MIIENTFAYFLGIIVLISWVIISYIKNYTLGNQILVSLFIIYLTTVVSITLFPIIIDDETIYPSNINLIPFVNYINSFFVTGVNKTMFLQLGGNILLAIPYGVAVPFFMKHKKRSNYIAVALIFPLSIEILQLIIGVVTQTMYRTVDIDDVILNFIGCIIGYVIYKILPNFMKEFFAVRKQDNQ